MVTRLAAPATARTAPPVSSTSPRLSSRTHSTCPCRAASGAVIVDPCAGAVGSDGGGQVVGHRSRRTCVGDLGRPGDRRGHQDGAGPGPEGGLHVRADVTDQDTVRRRYAQLAGGRPHHGGGRLATAAAVAVTVRTHLPGVERSEQLVDSTVDGGQLLGADQAAGDPGLVADDTDPHLLRAETVEHRPGPRDGHDLLGIGEIGDVVDQRAVPVEQQRSGGTPSDAVASAARPGAARSGPPGGSPRWSRSWWRSRARSSVRAGSGGRRTRP